MAWDSFLPGGGKKKAPRNALAAGVSAGVDQLQGLGYSAIGGVADMVGAEGVQNWANERAALQQEEAAKAGRPDLERLEDQTLGSALPFIGYQIAKQVPLMGAVMGAQMIPGVGQAASALGLSRLGAVAPRFLGGGGLQAGAGHAAARAALAQGQALGASTLVGSGLGFGSMYGESVEGGDPSPWKAAALAPIYGVSEAVVPAAVRGLLRAPANFSGNLLTRMGKTALMAGGGEAGTELVQNELEMGMRSDLTDEEMFSRRLNSAATGGLVGGALGSLGGIRRPRQESSPGIDPLQDQQQGPQRGLPPNLVTQDDTFGQRVAQRWAGPDAPLEGKERKQREAEYEAMFAEPSGLRVADPKTGVERELTVGDTWEMYQRARQAMPAGTAPDYESWLAGTGPSEWNADPMTSAVQTGDASATYVDLVGSNTPPETLDANLSGGGTGPFAYSGRGALPPQGAQPGAYLPPFPEATQLPDTPPVMQANQFGQVGASDAQNATLAAGAPSDMGAELGRQKALEARAAQMKLEELKRAAAAKAEEIKANEARAAEFGIKGDKGVGLFVELAKMHAAGQITDAQFAENAGALKARKFGSTQKWIAATTDPTNPLSPNFKKENNAPQREQVAGQAPAPAGEASTAPDQAAAPGATVVPQQAATAAAGGVDVGTTAATQPAVQGPGGRAGATPVGGGNAGGDAGLDAGRSGAGAAAAPAVGSPEGVAVPAGRAVPGPVTDKPASPGARMVRAVEKTSGNKMPRRVVDRLYLLMGMDKDGDIVGPMLTLSEVAAAEAARAGKKKPFTKAAIAADLERHGVDVGAEALVKARQMFEREMGGTGETASEDQLGMAVDEEGRITGAARVREDGTPEMSDAAAFNAAAGGLEGDEDAADGASTKDGANSGGDGGANVRVRQSLRLLADPKKSPQFNDAQRAAFADVLAWARADREAKLAAKIAANPEKADALREADAKKKPLTLLQAADALAGDKKLFPEESDRQMLKAVLGNTRGQNAAAGVKDAVRRVLEVDKGPDPELVARNEQLIAENARLNDERLAAQREDIAATVRDLLDPQFSDGDILDAKDAWEEYSDEPVSATRPDPDNPGRTITVEITAPAWDAVPAELQAQWVKLTAARYTEGSVISAKDYARRFDAIADEAAKAGAADSRRDVVRSDPADEGRDQPGSGAGRQDAAGGVPGGSDQAGAAGGEATTEVASEVVGPEPRPAAPQLPNEPLTLDGDRLVRETIRTRVMALPDPRIARLEKFYNALRDTEEFLSKVKEDVVRYVNQGADAVSAKIRDIIKQIQAGVLTVMMVFNPGSISPPEAFAVFPKAAAVAQTTQQAQAPQAPAKATLPAGAEMMSPAGRQAFETLIPALKGKLGDKLLTIADKPSGRVFVFDGDGNLIVQAKALFGAAEGDLYVGNNDVPSNRVTPAGLFGLKLVDAARGGSAKKTAGDYDFGKVFALEDPDAVVTIMHSVWLKEKDAAKRAAALKNDDPKDSRYSFGCINLDKATYKALLDKYQSRMDGSKLFVVPDNQAAVQEFLSGDIAQNKGGDRLVRESVAQAGAQSGAKFSKGGPLGSSTVAQVRAEIEEWLGINPRRLKIVQSVADLPADVRNAVHSKEGGGSRVRGVVLGDKAYLVAGNITPGTARSVFTHEVGVHLGMESILSAKKMEILFGKIVEWSMRDDGSLESRLATKARDRARAAGTPLEDYQAETIAYFTEEAVDAGIDPTAVKYKSELDRWFRTLWSAFKTALRRLRLANIDKLTAQDVVDLAYGAARLEMAGGWHGTAARFRKFSNDKIGTGEGAQAFGWGSYLAQSEGVGRGYWKADVERKSTGETDYYFDGEKIDWPPTDADGLAKTVAARWVTALPQYANNPKAVRGELALYGNALGLDEAAVDQALKVYLEKYSSRIDAFEERARGGPEGSLLRVDIGVADDEMLDWDLPMSEQSEKVRRAIGASGYDYLVGDGFITGGAFYELLTDEMKYEHMGSNGKKEASLLLDQIGIKGIRFLDGNSRRRKFSDYPRNAELRALVDRELGQSYKVAMLLQEAKVMSDAQLRRDVGVSQELVDEVRELQAWLKSPNRSDQATRNIVVFNDANMYRVLTHPAADLSRVKFSVGSAVVDAAERTLGPQGGMMATDIAHLGRKLVNSLAYLHDLVEEHKGKLPSAERWYKAMNKVTAARNRLASGAEQIAAAADKLDAGVGRVNEFISRSTYEQKWGYDPKTPGKAVTVDPALAAEFRKLSTAEQKVVRDVFAHGDKMLAEKYRVLEALGIDDIFTGTGQIRGPYAPLKRFGDYVAVLKSAELRAAEQARDDARAAKLKESPDHYVVSYFDTLGQARQFAKANADKYALADAFEKSVRIGELQPMNVKVLQRVREAMKADGLPADVRARVDQIVTDMYFQSIDEHHARTSGIKRMNRAGYDADMIRSFLSHARAEAGFLSNLEFGGEVNGHFYEMQREAKNQKTGKRDAQEAFNSFARHYAENLDFRETPWQDRAMALTSAWQLATSVGYHLTNATQGMMVTVPRLAADFNDYTGAWRNLMVGYGVVRDVGVRGNIDLSKVKDVGLRAALQEAADAGVLDVGMDEDLTHFERTRTGVNAIDAASSVARKTLHLLRQVSRAVESANRIAAATAGYRMAMVKWGDAAKAQEYAVNILRSTQGDFSRTGAPLLLKRLPKVMTQYRKYQLMMGALYVKAFRQAFASSDPATQAIGRRMLAYKLGHTAIAAGALGMPMVNIAGMVFAALAGGDDEPADLERWLREQIGDEDLANALLHGPLSLLGLDMSSKLGDDKIFSILPYTDINLTSADGLMKTAWGALGPSAAQAATFARGAEYMARGDFYKGLEGFMPKGVSSAMKAFRIANEGFTLKNGDVMFKPEDINGMALALDALGLPSAEFKRMEWIRGQQYEIGRFYVDRTKQIQREYAKAAKNGDSDEMLELREQWRGLQDGKDRVRQYFNDADDALKRQPLSTLLKYPKVAAKREEKLQRQAQ